MTAEAKKTMKVGALDFIDTLKVALQNELQQDPTTPRKTKIIQAAKKLHQLYAPELDKQQGKGLLFHARRRDAADLIEVLLLMGFDNTSLLPGLLFEAQDKHLIKLLIKKYGAMPYLFIEAQESFDFNMNEYLRANFNRFNQAFLEGHRNVARVDCFLLDQHTQYKEYLASFFHCIFLEAFNQHVPVANKIPLAAIISDYVGFGLGLNYSVSNAATRISAFKCEPLMGLGYPSDHPLMVAMESSLNSYTDFVVMDEKRLVYKANLEAAKERILLDEYLQRRDKLLKPLIDYCNSHFLDFEARQVLNSLLDEKRLFSEDLEQELDILLDNPVHWSKSYYGFLLLARLNVQQETHNAIANERKEHIISALVVFTNIRKIQYRQECKSYYVLHQRYGALLEDYLKLKNNFESENNLLLSGSGVSGLILIIQIVAMWAINFLSCAGIAVCLAALGCTFILFICELLISVNAPHGFSGDFRFQNISLFSCPNLDVTIKNLVPEEDNQLQLDQLKVKYESIQAASAGLKNAWRRLQDNEQYYRPYARKEFASVQIQYNQQFKFLLGLACFSPVALTMGIIGICLFNPLIFIGLTTGAAASTLSSAYGFFKRAQYSLSKPARTVEANVEPEL